ncbi:MAG TPA: DUF1203 domain-containing protein [Nocardioides sp.]|jgi:hypothetical protein|uniref:DUF1203 domain-containing protein n=1 Tax=Nocardioides sp. TaxID=35761 RepID=UPI002E308517|nr:DUF1203 domain-containing protein [Nocardioides sp.]HEX3932353.1 DUF1203 domain-containing protein [Nocardioides sp.]
MTTQSRHTLTVHAIDPARLDAVRRVREDGWGNALTPFAAAGEGEPLRCCLRYAGPGETIALISYAPFTATSVWREVGPVYVHAERCPGYAGSGLPEELRRGPRVLRTYRVDGTMDYAHNTLTGDEDLEPVLDRLLDVPGVAIAHVRTALPQCFLYAVTR